MSNNVNDGSYAQYPGFNTYSYQCIKYLMDNNEVVWKLLYYNTPDAWSQSSISEAQKVSMIYAGGDITTQSRVFLNGGQPDVLTEENAILRISPYSIFPENRTVGTVAMYFEFYANYKIDHLSNYTTRVDTAIMELVQTFNGALIEGVNGGGGLGRLFFDRLGSQNVRLENGGQPPFKGKWIIMANKSN